MEEKRLRKLSFTPDSDGARAFRLYENPEVRPVPRRRCAADLLREKYLREQRNG